jgi:hypothetical protein
MVTRNAERKIQLEPIDIYGNWTVKSLKVSHKAKNGLQVRKSKFKIRNNGSAHVFEKKQYVDWNGNATVIPLVEIARSDPDYLAGLRLWADVRIEGRRYVARFGSDSSGRTLRFQIKEIIDGVGLPNQGTWGTAGRGG